MNQVYSRVTVTRQKKMLEVDEVYDVVTWGTNEKPGSLWLEFPDGSRLYIMLFRIISYRVESICSKCGK